MTEQKTKISLKSARINAEMTQAQVSELSNISIDRICKAEKSTENNTLRITEICKLCEIYGVGLSDVKF